MPRYCVNRQAQPTGEHEVHNLDVGCEHLPDYSNRLVQTAIVPYAQQNSITTM